MNRYEIIEQPALTDSQQLNCEFHSFINLFNIIFGELQLMAELSGNRTHFNGLLDMCRTISQLLIKRDKIHDAVSLFTDFRNKIIHQTGDTIIQSLNIPPDDKKELIEYHRLLLEILQIAEIRINELHERINQPLQWKNYSIEEVDGKLKEVMKTIAENSKGKYKINFCNTAPASPPAPDEYILWLDWIPNQNGNFYIPAVFNDIIRDLTANARKYSPPGSVIHTTLKEDNTLIQLIVEDEGCGIPDEEIKQVVNFGYRATNTRTQPTFGGGFGLTKAWYICNQFNGRMWIESELKKGTKITTQIPCPTH